MAVNSQYTQRVLFNLAKILCDNGSHSWTHSSSTVTMVQLKVNCFVDFRYLISHSVVQGRYTDSKPVESVGKWLFSVPKM
jgi:hypothetical protein